MAFDPETLDEIFQELKDDLQTDIIALDNFTPTSFNYLWTRAFSRKLHDTEVELLDAQLAGWIDYAGGPINEDDLADLDVDGVSVNELDQQDSYLDELVKIVGVERDPGTKATGQVTFRTTSDSVTIPNGTIVATDPDNDGDFLEYETDSDVSPSSGNTSVQADITAVDVGAEYNVGTINIIPDPPTGVISVSSANGAGGGEDRESNDDLRDRAKEAIFTNSGGGTVKGMEGFIEDEVDGVTEVQIVEYFNGDFWHGDISHGHVIVNGLTNSNRSSVESAIEDSRPVAVKHFIEEVTPVAIRVDVDLVGSNVDSTNVDNAQQNVQDYINGLNIEENVIDTQIIQTIMNASDDILDLNNFAILIDQETVYYDDQGNNQLYELLKGNIMEQASSGSDNKGIIEITTDGGNTTLTEGTDYDEADVGSGSGQDGFEILQNNNIPAIDTSVTTDITYDTDQDVYFIDDSLTADGINSVTDSDGNTFSSSEYKELNVKGNSIPKTFNGIEWTGGNTPDNNEVFTVDYRSGPALNVTYRVKEFTDVPINTGEVSRINPTGTDNIDQA